MAAIKKANKMPISKEIKAAINNIKLALIIFEIDVSGKISYGFFNQTAEAYYRIKNKDYEGKPLSMISRTPHKDYEYDRQLLEIQIQQCIKSKQPLEAEKKYIDKNGQITWTRHTMVPASDEDGIVKQILVTSINITELIETEVALEQAMTHMLSGFVEICAKCKKIHHQGEWLSIDVYAAYHMDFHNFSHGVCSQCEKLFE